MLFSQAHVTFNKPYHATFTQTFFLINFQRFANLHFKLSLAKTYASCSRIKKNPGLLK